MFSGILDLRPRALADIATHVDYKDGIRHVDLALVHIVQHFLGTLSPDLVVAGVAEEADADDDVAFEGQTLLSFEELLLEACASAEGNDFELPDHGLIVINLGQAD